MRDKKKVSAVRCRYCDKEIRGMGFKDVLYNLDVHIRFKHNFAGKRGDEIMKTDKDDPKQIWADMWNKRAKRMLK